MAEHGVLTGRAGLPWVGRPAVWGAALVVAATATVVSFAAPTVVTTTQPRPLGDEIVVTVTTLLPPNEVYEGPRLPVDAPVFRSVVDRLDLEVRYRALDPQIVSSQGQLSTVTTVASSSGWTRTLTRTDPVPIIGGEASTVVSVELDAVDRLAAQVDEAAGVTGTVRLEITATAELFSVMTGSGPDTGLIPPPHTATLAYLIGEAVVSPELVGGAPAAADPELPGLDVGTGARVPGVFPRAVPIEVEVEQPAVVSTPLVSVRRSTLRWVLLVATLLLAVGYAVARRVDDRLAGRDEAERLYHRHRPTLVLASELPETIDHPPVFLASFAGLQAVSEVLALPLLAVPNGTHVDFTAVDGPRRYVYRVNVQQRSGSWSAWRPPGGALGSGDRSVGATEVAAEQPLAAHDDVATGGPPPQPRHSDGTEPGAGRRSRRSDRSRGAPRWGR